MTNATTRNARLETVMCAIREGRAFLGDRPVVSYDDETGRAVTQINGDYWSQRTYMVVLDKIEIR